MDGNKVGFGGYVEIRPNCNDIKQENNSNIIIKRKRGRPRKSEEVIKKSKRGRPKKVGRKRKKKLSKYVIVDHKRILRTTYNKLFVEPVKQTKLGRYHKVLYAYHYFRYCRKNCKEKNKRGNSISEKEFYKLFSRAIELMTESLCQYQYLTIPYLGELSIKHNNKITSNGKYKKCINYPKTVDRFQKTGEKKVIYSYIKRDYKICFKGGTRLYDKLKFKPSRLLKDKIDEYNETLKNEIDI